MTSFNHYYLDPVPVIASVTIILSTLVTLVLLFRNWLELKLQGLLLISLGFMGIALAIIPNTVFLFVDDPSFSQLRALGSRLGLAVSSLGLISILIGHRLLSGKGFHIGERVVMVTAIFSLGLVFNDIQARREGNEWDIYYGTQSQFLLFSLCLFIIVSIITFEMFISSSKAKGIKKRYQTIAFSGWFMNVLGSILLGIELELLRSSAILTLVMGTIGFLIIGLATLLYRYTLIPSSININAIVVSHIDSGLPMFSYFQDSSLKFSDTMLSASIHGVLSVLTEVTNEKIPQFLTFQNYEIVIVQSKEAIAYAFSYNRSQVLSMVLNLLLTTVNERFDEIILQEGTVLLEMTQLTNDLLDRIL